MDPNQDTRLSVLESQVTTITNSVGKLETKVESNYATLHHRISDLRDDFHNNLETKTNKIFEKMDEQSKQSSSQHPAIADKITSIERWKWMVIGGAIVIGYVLAHIKLEKLF